MIEKENVYLRSLFVWKSGIPAIIKPKGGWNYESFPEQNY